MHASDGETFRARKRAAFGARFDVLPVVSGASVEEDGDEEEIEEALALFDLVDGGGVPGFKQGCDAGPTGIEVTPSAMRRDLWEEKGRRKTSAQTSCDGDSSDAILVFR